MIAVPAWEGSAGVAMTDQTTKESEMTDTTAADIFAEEPPNGTRLVVWREDEPPIVVERNDQEAGKWPVNDNERWFDEPGTGPISFEDVLADATMVHAVVPLNASGLALVDTEV